VRACGRIGHMLKTLLARLAGADRVEIGDDLWQQALERLPCAAALAAGDRDRLRALCQQLLARKEMAAAAGLELTAAIQVQIAVQACLPILNLGIDWYRGWTSIVVYPSDFVAPRRITDDDGVVHEYDEPISGEAWEGGPLVVAWSAAGDDHASAWSHNVVIHEFAHKLDMLNGDADGLPPFDRSLHPKLDARRWRATLADAFERFGAELDLIESDLPADVDPDSSAADPYYAHLPLDPYAAQDEGEFFAVSSEQFFVDPQRLARAFPDWYGLLAQFFRQDPRARAAPQSAGEAHPDSAGERHPDRRGGRA